MKPTMLILKFILVLSLWVAGVGLLPPQTAAQDDGGFTYAGTIDAPAFPNTVDWINVTEPLTFEDLQGKIVILDFWTYGCINCIHVIPDLKRLEAEYPDELVVIGVHSAKFDNEGQTDNIRQIVQRYGVTHPVINDSEFVVWSRYSVQAWPTLVLIDPMGKYVGSRAGEGVYEVFKPIVETMVSEYNVAGLLNLAPLPQLAPELDSREATALLYPGKVLADVAGNRLIVSDSSHNRLVVSTLDTFDDTQVIGSTEAGFVDGDFATARFRSPQGLALDGDTLYVADTENHAIRVVDFATQTVSTLVGTGEQADTYPPVGGTAPNVKLSSPWDLTLYNNILYVAMAGPHQLWRIDLATGVTEAHAGNGGENIIDGALAQAQLAQPSGIDTDGTLLYFADSEASGIRSAAIDLNGRVTTIVGTGLFDFGDVDGVGDDVRLQHPLGVVVAPDGLLYVADTYNNKIKTINPTTRESLTFAGTGAPALVDGDFAAASFYEPGGLDYADGKLYVADTNNHAIRIIDLAEGIVRTVEFVDPTVLMPTPETPTVSLPENPFAPQSDVVKISPIEVAPGEGTLVFDVRLPDGYKLNALAPFTAQTSNTSNVIIAAEYQDYQQIVPDLPVSVPVTFSEGLDELKANMTVYWCEAINETLCFVSRFTFQVPVTVSSDATTTSVVMSNELVPPAIENSFP